MSEFPDNHLVEDIATSLKTRPALLEKDWYVSIVIQILSSFENLTFIPIFGGGTSLMKGHKVINRFSEDIDIKIIPVGSKPFIRSKRRQCRELILNAIDAPPDLSILQQTFVSRNISTFFSVLFSYPKAFGEEFSIRAEIKIEGTFVDAPLFNTVEKSIQPIISEYIPSDIQSNIGCVSIRETGSEKLSAVLWRILSRDRYSEDDDKTTIIRHLYDLSQITLKFKKQDITIIREEGKNQYSIDCTRGKECPENFEEAAQSVLEILTSDPLYQTEYDQYVTAMCFGPEFPKSFKESVESLKKLLSNTY